MGQQGKTPFQTVVENVQQARWGVRWASNIARGWRAYRDSGTTPPDAYASMRNLYCLTNGYSNDAICAAISRRYPPKLSRPAVGVLGSLDVAALNRITADIGRDGFCVFRSSLPAHDIAEIKSFASNEECQPTIRTQGGGPGRGMPVRYAAARDASVRFDFTPATIMKSTAVQRLVADPTVLAVASAYLACEPVLDLVAMWWSRPPAVGGDLKSEAAQMYHFDMDRIAFLKFFFYLTDVDTETGPHCFVRGSHRRKPADARRDGRWKDEDLMRVFERDKFVELTGQAGTIMAVDTRGFHKGKELLRDERLLLQLEFAVSRFGQNYARFPVSSPIPELRSLATTNPRVLQNCDLGDRGE